jgi:ribosomal protein S18 acetylase RimI-like enzyme
VSLAFRRLVPGDEAAVRGWIEAYLVEHVGWWLAARGLAGDPARLVRERGLVDRDWEELLVARAADFVVVAERDGAPVGIVRAALRDDPHLGVRGGVLQWLAVDPGARGRGVATALVQRATDWFDAHGASAELFVSDSSAAARRAYERAGFRVADARMIRAAAADDRR